MTGLVHWRHMLFSTQGVAMNRAPGWVCQVMCRLHATTVETKKYGAVMPLLAGAFGKLCWVIYILLYKNRLSFLSINAALIARSTCCLEIFPLPPQTQLDYTSSRHEPHPHRGVLRWTCGIECTHMSETMIVLIQHGVQLNGNTVCIIPQLDYLLTNKTTGPMACEKSHSC
jgi:hypothetical protein